MTATSESIEPKNSEDTLEDQPEEKCYRIQFRKGEQIFLATSKIKNLNPDEVIMAQTDHGLEPAIVLGLGPQCLPGKDKQHQPPNTIARRGTREESEKYSNLLDREKEAFDLCQQYIAKHKLEMKLTKVERFFNGSKIIFYFTAENRVDFRELVKDLVQEFRTRVEIRQIGVRHETKMIGGLGCCGRELCCSSFIKNFEPVSIKMAKEQDLPLNPTKISGICNRLLCCLTYEFPTYKAIKREMPKPGKQISIKGETFKVLQNNVLNETITVVSLDKEEKPIVLNRDEWEQASRSAPKKAKDTKKSE